MSDHRRGHGKDKKKDINERPGCIVWGVWIVILLIIVFKIFW